MKLLYISSVGTPTPPVAYGGLEYICWLQALGMKQEGHDVTVVASGDSPDDLYKKNGIELIPTVLAHISEQGIPEPLSNAVWEEALRDRWGQFDLVVDHTHSHHSMMVQLRHVRREQKMPPVIHCFHDAEPIPPGRVPPLLNPNFVVPSYDMAYRLTRNVPGLHVRTVWHGIPVKDFPYTPEKEDYWIYLGRMQALKGPHIAVDLAKNLGLNLKLVGDDTHLGGGDSGYTMHLKMAAANSGGKIQYLGKVSNEEKVELLRKAKGAIFPSQFEEPFGLMAVEAMACGTPVVVPSFGGLPEIVTTNDGFDQEGHATNRCGVVAHNMAEMLRGIRFVNEAQPRMSRHCREAAERFFDVSVMNSKHEALYREVVNGGGW